LGWVAFNLIATNCHSTFFSFFQTTADTTAIDGLYERLAVTDDNLNVVHVQRGGKAWRVTRTSLVNLHEPTTVIQVDLNHIKLKQLATSDSCTIFTVEPFSTKHFISGLKDFKTASTAILNCQLFIKQ
jgi:hypothetical protein